MSIDVSTGLFALFVSAFTSATILPGTSEAVLVTLVLSRPDSTGAAWAIATLGNTLGGLTSYALGRLLPAARTPPRAVEIASRYGVFALLLSWVPFLGDALCVASGWLRHNVIAAAVAMALGKALRYAVLIAGVRALGS